MPESTVCQIKHVCVANDTQTIYTFDWFKWHWTLWHYIIPRLFQTCCICHFKWVVDSSIGQNESENNEQKAHSKATCRSLPVQIHVFFLHSLCRHLVMYVLSLMKSRVVCCTLPRRMKITINSQAALTTSKQPVLTATGWCWPNSTCKTIHLAGHYPKSPQYYWCWHVLLESHIKWHLLLLFYIDFLLFLCFLCSVGLKNIHV